MRNKTLVFLFILLLHGGLVLAQQMEIMATVEPVKGSVAVQLPGRDFAEIKASTPVPGGATIRTGSGAEALIKWANGNIIKLTSFTTLKLEGIKKNFATGEENSQVFLWNGDVVARAKKLTTQGSSYELRTPSAIAGVRGTSFRAQVTTSEESSFWCIEGAIEVTAQGQAVQVGAGTKTSVKKGEAPQPAQPMTAEDKKAVETVQNVSEPSLEVDAPVGNLVTDTSPVEVRGHVEPGSSVTIQDFPATVSADGTFSGKVDLEVGTNQVRITVLAKNGIRKTITRAVKYRPKEEGPTPPPPEQDTTPPALAITSPIDGLRTRSNMVTVTGKTESKAIVSISGQRVQANSDGRFQLTIRLIEGDNSITVQTSDPAGNTAAATVTVIRDTTPPMLTITEPPARFPVRTGEACEPAGATRIICRVSGITEPLARLKINGISYPVESDGSFRAEIVISYTATEIKVEAADDLGNLKTEVLKRAVDYSQPSFITLESGAATLYSNKRDQTTITVTVKNFLMEPIAGAQVSIALSPGAAGTLSVTTGVTDANGVFSATLRAGSSEEMIPAVVNAASGEVQARTQINFLPYIPEQPE